MLSRSTAVLWHAAYRRTVLSAFDTVPFYRERWALDGRTEPTLVPGRVGGNDGATHPEELLRTLVDLVPLAGGGTEIDAARGLGHVLRMARPVRPRTLVVIADRSVARPPSDLPKGMWGAAVDPETLGRTDESGVVAELVSTLCRRQPVLVVGGDKDLTRVFASLPGELKHLAQRLPHRTLTELDGGPYGVLHDPVLGYLGALRDCGRWHLDHRRVYARPTKAGLAFTLLTQRSPMLVDVLVGGGVRGQIRLCPRHGTPVVS
ncbi:hypothetical protein [Saccharomonospora xinjiangensis]|uniref:Uncharacterized protein n=1 Tax=Saccharomonospora xinjiangensis XJ-54 TaxID=882086 RepID=I0V355_9PSEU|nr:hypothetical protein [Saccharomonospora xinjiangensis]EID54558.1 hypothetical protein SacxiDRAFT_2329 [Saccharomonospora xinjiangensis XJ-54]